MLRPEKPANEHARLTALHAYRVLDTPADAAFDALAELASFVAETPIALVSLVDAERQWFKARRGLDVCETSREVSFCGHVVTNDAALLVSDTCQDPRFADNPLVLGGPQLRFYAGFPLRNPEGLVMGTLCVADTEPRTLSARQLDMLQKLTQQVVDQLERRRERILLEQRSLEQERLLRESSDVRSRMQSIVDSTTYCVIETTPDGVIREFNRSAEQLLGYRAEEVVGKHTPAIIHDPAEVAVRTEQLKLGLGAALEPGFETFVALARRGAADEREWTYIAKDGSRFPVKLSVTARRDAQGEIIGFVGIAMDIWAQKHAEEQLRASEARLKAVFASMAEGLVIQGADGTIDEANRAAQTILGLSREQLLGRASVDPSWNTTRADGSPFPGDEHPAMVSLRTGLPQSDVLMRVARPDGSSVLITINSQPLCVTPGASRPELVVTTFRDITRQAEVERALRESEERSRTVIQTAADAILTLDEFGELDQVNPAAARIFGYAQHELIGTELEALIPAPERAEPTNGQRRARWFSRPLGVSREVTALRKDGSYFEAELTVSQFKLNGKRLFTGVVRDISDRKRVERMQAEFVSTVSHELRTPLTSIRGSLGLISAGLLGELPAEAKTYVDIALTNSERLVRLINDLLELDRLGSEAIEFRLCPVDLGALVRSAVAANDAYASTYKVRLQLAGPIPEGEVMVDPDRLMQALTNLISNAVKFSPAGADVELSVQQAGAMFRIQVRDHGPGIPDEFQARIFQRFAQADSSTTREKGGTGLGLSITKSIIEKMNGRVGFSAAPGGGTTFFCELPHLVPAHSVPGPPSSLSACVSERPRLLHIESDGDLRRILQKTLPEDWHVVGAESSEHALHALSREAFDVVVLEPALPDEAGEELLESMGRAQLLVFSNCDPPPALGSRAARTMIKSRYTPKDVRDAVLALKRRKRFF